MPLCLFNHSFLTYISSFGFKVLTGDKNDTDSKGVIINVTANQKDNKLVQKSRSTLKFLS